MFYYQEDREAADNVAQKVDYLHTMQPQIHTDLVDIRLVMHDLLEQMRKLTELQTKATNIVNEAVCLALQNIRSESDSKKRIVSAKSTDNTTKKRGRPKKPQPTE